MFLAGSLRRGKTSEHDVDLVVVDSERARNGRCRFMRFAAYDATVRGIPIYACSKCGEQCQGRSVTLRVKDLDGASLPYTVHLLGREAGFVSNQNIPVGWSSWGIGDVRCPACTKGTR